MNYVVLALGCNFLFKIAWVEQGQFLGHIKGSSPIIFWNHIWDQEKKLNPIGPKSQFQFFFLEIVHPIEIDRK